VAVEQGHSAEAVRRGREAHDLAVGVGEPVSAGGALLPLLRGLVASGRTDEAIATLAGHRLFSESHPGLGSRELLLLAAAEVAAPGPPDAAAAAAAAAQGAAVEGGVTAYGARAAVLHGIGLLRSGNAAAAQAATARARHLAGAVGDRNSECAAALVDCAAARGHGRGAAGPAHRALGAASGLGLAPVVADGLDLVAGLCLDAGRPRVAARLHAAADRLREELGLVPSPLAVHLREDDGPGVAVALGEAGLAEARREGAALDATAAVAYAERSRGRRGRPTVGWDSLTPTERDVVTLVAEGLSNQAIGDRLLVTSGTVRTHLRSVFAKLGVTSRAELAAESARRSR